MLAQAPSHLNTKCATSATIEFIEALEGIVRRRPLIKEADIIRTAVIQVALTQSSAVLVEYSHIVDWMAQLRTRPARKDVYVETDQQIHDYVLHMLRSQYGYKCHYTVDNQYVVLHPNVFCTHSCQAAARRATANKTFVPKYKCPSCYQHVPTAMCTGCEVEAEPVTVTTQVETSSELPWAGYEFELVTALRMSELGYQNITVSAPGADGGIDIEAFQIGEDGELQAVAVQVKGNKTAGVEAVRAFVTASDGYDQRIYVSRVKPTSGMTMVASSYGLLMVGPDDLSHLVNQLATATQRTLETLCDAADITLKASSIRPKN